MSRKSAKKAVSTFADLPELIAEETATPEFEASFGDPLPLSIIEYGDEPGEHTMPEPFAAQKVCGELISSLHRLLHDTRLDPLGPDIAWGIVNSFNFVAGTLERREDRLADKIREMTRRMEPGEVFNKDLEDTQLQCQSLAEQRANVETMRDYAAAMYSACWRKAWAPSKGSKASSVTTASYISAVDFLRERALAKREKYQPDGLVVVSSGPAIWDDWKPIWDTMSAIKQRTPRMIVVTTGQRTGWDAIVAAWCAREGVPLVAFALTGRGKAAFARNRKIGELDISEAVLGEGSGIQANLYQILRKKGVPIHAFRKPADAPKPRKPEASDAYSFRRARRYA
ncbi:SLOG family protein [Sphingomonas sp. HH69]